MLTVIQKSTTIAKSKCKSSFILTTASNIDETLHSQQALTGLILGLPPANERPRYYVTTSLIGLAQNQNQPWLNTSQLPTSLGMSVLSSLENIDGV